MVDRQPTDPGGEAFIEPQLTPPIHGDKVAKPLMRKLVRNDVCDTITIAVCRCSWVEEYCGRPAMIVSAALQIISAPELTGR